MNSPVNHSYFFKYDEVFGWGDRSFFTYYSEFGRAAGATAAEVAVMMAVFLVSLVTNICLVWIILRRKELHTITNYFILNLALADVLFSASIPVVAIVRFTETWILGDIPCRLLLYFQFVCGAVLLWSLTVISFERYRRIVSSPMKARMSRFHVVFLIVVIWLSCLVSCTPVAVCFTALTIHHPSRDIKICTLIFPNISVRVSYLFVSLMLVVNCLLPLVWLIFNYISIFRKLFANEKRWQQQTTTNNHRLSLQFADDTNISPEKFRHRSHYRTVKILLLNVFFTILMWTPIIVMMGLIHYDSSKEDDYFLHSHDFIATLMIALAGTAINPVLYGVFNSNIRAYLKKSWHSSFCSKTDSTNDTATKTRTVMELDEQKKSVDNEMQSSTLSILQQTDSKRRLFAPNTRLRNLFIRIRDAIGTVNVKRFFR